MSATVTVMSSETMMQSKFSHELISGEGRRRRRRRRKSLFFRCSKKPSVAADCQFFSPLALKAIQNFWMEEERDKI